jgi:tetratricopeptide (TPR) repeat protein
LLAGLALGALVFVLYVPVMRAGFIWDDDVYVVQNGNLRDWQGLARIWVQPATSPQYYPLVFTSFWLERQLFGPGAGASHAVNIGLHILNALLLWAILRRLDVRASYVIALAFALHPVQLESVAWITERKNTLSGFFYLAAALAYLKAGLQSCPTAASVAAVKSRAATEREAGGSTRFYWLALVLFVFALLCKTVTATLPMALLIVLWWKRKVTRGDILRLSPLFALGVLAGLATAWIEVYHVGATGEEWHLSAIERILVAGRALWFYLATIVWPHPLTFMYPRWHIDAGSAAQYLFPLSACAVGAALWLLRGRIGKAPLVAALFFACTLVPALGFLNVYPMRYSYVADHFQYLASIGPIALAVVLLKRLLDRIPVAGLRIAAVAVLVVLLIGVGRAESGKYDSLDALWQDTIAKDPGSWFAYNNLGTLRLAQGRLEDARCSFEEALRFKPDLAEADNNLGNVWFRRGDLEQAARYHRKAVALKADYAEGYNNLGIDLVTAGNAADAIASYRRAVAADPRYAMAHYNLANALVRVNDVAGAEEHYREAIFLDPDFALAHYFLGLQMLREGRTREANDALDAAFRLKPDFAQGYYELGNVQLQRGLVADAVASYSRAVGIKPDYAEAHANLGSALMRANRAEDAIVQYRAALALKPDYAIALNNLGFALEQLGRREEAAAEYRQALRVDPNNVTARENLARVLRR